MQFLVTGHDGTDSEAGARRQAAREGHLRLGDEMRVRGEALYAAALLNDAGAMVGSVMVVEFASREGVDAWLKVEPYVLGKVWERVDVRPCRVAPGYAAKGPAKAGEIS